MSVKLRNWVIGIGILLVLILMFIFHPRSRLMLLSSESMIRVHILDVGQADSIFIELPDEKFMLIDAGKQEDSEKIKAYLDRFLVQTLDYVLITHPHSDHTGGMGEVIKGYHIGQIYVPTIEQLDSTCVNLDVDGYEVIDAKAGTVIYDENGLRVEILAPTLRTYSDINDYSAVVKITYFDKSFLFTGDATILSEMEMLAYGQDVDADVLKVSHHGSNTSTCQKFLDAVSPDYAVFSLESNRNGFPDSDVLERIKKAGVSVYRTDLDGTVIFISDGRTIDVIKEKQ